MPSREDEAQLFDELIGGMLGEGTAPGFSPGGLPGSAAGAGETMSVEAAEFLQHLSLPEVGAMQGAPDPMEATSSIGTAGPSSVSDAPLQSRAPAGHAAFACWGAELLGSASHCIPGFVSGKAHFKNKFCARCREGVEVPVSRVRALSEEQRQQVFNSLQSGFWKRAPLAMGGGEVRIANNTITCDGPWLAVFRDAPPQITFETLPPKWVRGNIVKLCALPPCSLITTEYH